MSGLGPSFMKIWTCRSSLRSGSRNAWTRIKNVNGASHLSKFWNFFGEIQMISCRDWWPWMKPGYFTMTQRQSNNQWSGGRVAHPTPKNSESKICWKCSRLDFLRSRWHPPHWLSFKGPNYQHRVLLISANAIEGHSEGKTPREGHQRGLVLAQCPGSLGTCNPVETAYLGFQCLDHLPYSLDLSVLDYHLFPGLKKQLIGCHFSYDVEVIAAMETWLDGQPSEFFLSGLQKLERRAKKCIELPGEYVE